jgi:hypothetical protein
MTAHQLFLSEGLALAFLLSSFCFGFSNDLSDRWLAPDFAQRDRKQI